MATTRSLETDYLIVGCGAAGMAFADALVAHSDAQVVMVDRRHAPGGHWNDAYPFVRLHTPSSFYGVDSLPLGSQTIDRGGLNRGLYELASGPEICAYYDRVMRERLLPSGQVRYFPMCDYLGDRRFVSRVSGSRTEVKVRRRLVDATYLQASVPATSPAPFEIAPGARCVPVGELVQLAGHANGYVVVGAGKTAIDACLWLLGQGVAPGEIRWIKPREPWLVNRVFLQGGEKVADSFEGFSLVVEAAARARSAQEWLDRLAATHWVLRVDERVTPTMFKAATVTAAELEQLRRIEDVVRLGHVRRIGRDAIELEDGTVATSAGRLHVHCATAGLNLAPAVPIFGDDRIALQPIRFGSMPFGAALTALVEATRTDTAEKNRLCPPNPAPDVPLDFLRGLLVQWKVEERWQKEPDLQEWLEASRLNLLRGLPGHLGEPRVQEAAERFAEHLPAAIANAERLLARAAA